jgi:hypothetical protein
MRVFVFAAVALATIYGSSASAQPVLIPSQASEQCCKQILEKFGTGYGYDPSTMKDERMAHFRPRCFGLSGPALDALKKCVEGQSSGGSKKTTSPKR